MYGQGQNQNGEVGFDPSTHPIVWNTAQLPFFSDKNVVLIGAGGTGSSFAVTGNFSSIFHY